jgi:hypothetical protein
VIFLLPVGLLNAVSSHHNLHRHCFFTVTILHHQRVLADSALISDIFRKSQVNAPVDEKNKEKKKELLQFVVIWGLAPSLGQRLIMLYPNRLDVKAGGLRYYCQ